MEVVRDLEGRILTHSLTERLKKTATHLSHSAQ